MEQGSPERILQIGFGFWPSKVLLTAVALELFTHLGNRPMTADELDDVLGLHPRATFDFFDALVALGFLKRDGDGPAGRYSNSDEAAQFLDKKKPTYIGGILEMCNERLYPFWNDLGEALRTGKPQNEVKHGGRPLFEVLYERPERLEQFMGAMRSISIGNSQALAEKFDFSKYRTLCDVGGATGVLATTVARRHPHVQCISFDLPVVQPIAERWIAQDGLSDRVKAVSGDFLKDPLPKADIISMSLILHDWNLETKKHLIRLAHEALPAGGAFIVVENLIDDARRENAFGLMSSLNMLIETEGGFDFSGADFWSWCREAGFSRYEVLHLFGPSSAAIAYK